MYANALLNNTLFVYLGALSRALIVVQRYIEVDRQLQRVLAVGKVRGSNHSKDIRWFDITDEGLVIGEPFSLRTLQ